MLQSYYLEEVTRLKKSLEAKVQNLAYGFIMFLHQHGSSLVTMTYSPVGWKSGHCSVFSDAAFCHLKNVSIFRTSLLFYYPCGQVLNLCYIFGWGPQSKHNFFFLKSTHEYMFLILECLECLDLMRNTFSNFCLSTLLEYLSIQLIINRVHRFPWLSWGFFHNLPASVSDGVSTVTDGFLLGRVFFISFHASM